MSNALRWVWRNNLLITFWILAGSASIGLGVFIMWAIVRFMEVATP